MANRTALYVLLAALALAALTNRWVAASGSRPAFNIVSFDDFYFSVQWIAFGLTLGGLALLCSQWYGTGKFPALILLGVGLLGFFVATGIPQATNAQQWKAGEAGLTHWMKSLNQARKEEREAGEVAPHLLGIWKSDRATYSIERNSLTVAAGGKTETLDERCPGGASFKFAYATAETLHYNPPVYKYYDLLRGPPMPSLEVACQGRMFTFLKFADGRVLAFRDLHNPNPPSEETVTR